MSSALLVLQRRAVALQDAARFGQLQCAGLAHEQRLAQADSDSGCAGQGGLGDGGFPRRARNELARTRKDSSRGEVSGRRMASGAVGAGECCTARHSVAGLAHGAPVTVCRERGCRRPVTQGMGRCATFIGLARRT